MIDGVDGMMDGGFVHGLARTDTVKLWNDRRLATGLDGMMDGEFVQA